MKIQVDECEFLQNKLEFLDYVVTTDGIKTNPKKVQAVVDFPPPRTLKQLRSFLGMDIIAASVKTTHNL